MSDEPEFWVVASTSDAQNRKHWPAKFATVDEPRALCDVQFETAPKAVVDERHLPASVDGLCQRCKRQRDNLGAPDAAYGRSPADVLREADFEEAAKRATEVRH